MEKQLNKVRTKEQHSVRKILYFADQATANKFMAVFENRFKRMYSVEASQWFGRGRPTYGLAIVMCWMTSDDWKELNNYIWFEKCSWCKRNWDYFFRGFVA